MTIPPALTSVLCVALVAGVASWARQNAPVTAQEARTATQAEQRAYSPRERAALSLLAAVGNEQPSSVMVAEVVAWSIAEDGGDGAIRRNNPWNTTMCGFNMIGAINADGACGVGHYATMEDGIGANAATLMQGNFSQVREALLANDVGAFRHALWASPWAASRYNGGLDWPAYQAEGTQDVRVSSCPVDPCWQSGSGYGASHPGIDLGATLGQSVYATQDGTAALSDTWPCGNGLMITQGDTQVLMCHLSAFAVEDGSAVLAGDLVAYAGSTGLSTGPHVHYEVRVGGLNIDPSGVLR